MSYNYAGSRNPTFYGDPMDRTRRPTGPHLLFQANPGGEMAPGTEIEGAADWQRAEEKKRNVRGWGTYDYSRHQDSFAAQPAQAAAGTLPAGAGMPQSIGANALMTAPTQWGERRDPVMPLQGYQNALLRGF